MFFATLINSFIFFRLRAEGDRTSQTRRESEQTLARARRRSHVRSECVPLPPTERVPSATTGRVQSDDGAHLAPPHRALQMSTAHTGRRSETAQSYYSGKGP